MKKLLALALSIMLVLALCTACGTDPVVKDLENFLNVQMVPVNQNYENLKAELGKWETYAEDAQLLSSINDVLIPLVNDSMDLVRKIELNTPEVKSIKANYEDVMKAYKDSFQTMQLGLAHGDAEMFTEGANKLEIGVSLLDDYNASLEALASEKGMTIEY